MDRIVLASGLNVYASDVERALLDEPEISDCVVVSLPDRAGNTLAGLVIGSLSSLLGIGGGSMTVPWLLWHAQQVQKSIATAAACGYPIAVAGTLGFILLGFGWWEERKVERVQPRRWIAGVTTEVGGAD